MNARQGFIRALADAAKPDEVISTSQWAEANRILPPDSVEPGPWRNDRTPYLIEIQDSLSPVGGVRETYVKKGHQLGGSSSGENAIGTWISKGAGNILVVFDTLKNAEKWSVSRFEPMRESTPDLRKRIRDANTRGSDNTQLRKKFPGGMLQLVGGNSPGDLKSTTFRYVKFEEMDELPKDIGGQGSPRDLARNRTSNFQNKARIYGDGTPTIDGASAIDEEYKRGDQRKYMMPCPHCGHHQFFEWSNFKWTWGKPETIGYLCKECAVVGTEIEWKVAGYTKINGAYPSYWKPTATGEPGVRSYHLPSFYAPLGWRPWETLAVEWEAGHKDPVKFKRIVNNEWAECWQDLSKNVDENVIAKRATAAKLRTIPVGCLALVMAVDVQGYRLEYKILGLGRNKRHWVIDYGMIEGNPAREDVWNQLTDIRRRPIQNSFGISMRVLACAVDSGGHHTQEVYTYSRKYQEEGVFAVKGHTQKKKPIIGARPSVVDIDQAGHIIKGGAQLWLVGTDTAKDMLFGYLKVDEDAHPDEYFISFPSGLSEDYYKQLTSEVFDETKGLYLKRSGRRNEAIDLFVYCFAAAHHPRVRIDVMRDADWTRLEEVFEPRIRDLLSDALETPDDEVAPVEQIAQAARQPEEEMATESGWLDGYDVNL